MNALAIIAALLAVAGSAVMTVGVIAILGVRFGRPGTDRNLGIHAASLMQAAGIPLVLCAALAGDGALIARATVVAAFALLTGPLTTHALARLALDEQRRDSDVRGNGRRETAPGPGGETDLR